jgi:serine/threonine-protein kinase RsbT
MADDCGFDKLATEELALVTSEICENVIKHAEDGLLTISTENKNRILCLHLEDKGPGIADISLALEKGYSSIGGSLGLGLDIVRRLMDEMVVDSVVNQGTTIKLKKYLPLTDDIIDYGAISVAENRNLYNGDQYLIKEFDGDSVLLAVIDGIGQGVSAYVSAIFIKEIIAAAYRLPPVEILKRCHDLVKESSLDKGAAVSIAVLTPGKLSYAGVGDTHSYWMDDKLHLLKNRMGNIGTFQFKLPKAHELNFNEPVTICLCSDGIGNLLAKPETGDAGNMQQLAKWIYNNQVKSYGDATVLLAYYQMYSF